MKMFKKTLCCLALSIGIVGAAHAQTPAKKLVVYCPHPLVFIAAVMDFLGID